ncbi:helix-turn-helix domain-containing protein [Mobilicoccus sp.]|uniref:PucR family transcriptional regulator n=1 Tax=Mobilicoccus sp. TaxID=2034349 RepID=UPI0028AF1267|nr:helix-turn-helix domain-containing protein [Mobilicoccus sp.]
MTSLPDLPARLDISPALADRLRRELGTLADEAVDAIISEVPAYAHLGEQDGGLLREAVSLALGAFLTLASQRDDAAVPIAPSTSGAYDLGRGEARSGRSLEALLAAYHIGARVAWRRLSRAAADEGLSAPAVGAFAELVFAYIDALSATSVSGHSDEIAKSGRARERYLDRLAEALAAGADPRDLDAAASRAAWRPPTTLTAVVLPSEAATRVRHLFDERTLTASGETIGLGEDTAVLLLPDDRDRVRTRRTLTGLGASIGPARPWQEAHASIARAIRGVDLRRRPSDTVDTDQRLVDLVLTADPEARSDLRARVLAPLDRLRPTTRDAVEETLRSWMLHHGRRAEVAADLHVHPQTVRYRMGLARECFGDALDDPRVTLALVVALGATAPGRPDH